MTLKEQLEKDLISAIKERDELKTSVLRMVKASLMNAQIAKKSELNEDEVVSVIQKEARQRKDAIEQFEKGSRQDLADKEMLELKIIEKYLPEKMEEAELRIYIEKLLADTGEKNFGKLMGMIMGTLGSKADGSMVRKILEEKLN